MRRGVAVLVVGVAGLVVACGGDDGGGVSSGTSGATAAKAKAKAKAADRIVCRRALDAGATVDGVLASQQLQEWDRIARMAKDANPEFRKLATMVRDAVYDAASAGERAAQDDSYQRLTSLCADNNYDLGS